MKISSFAISLCFLMPGLIVNGPRARALSGESQECPKVKISCPAKLKASEILKFTASVTGGEPDEEEVPTYYWTVSAGSISSGQGTTSIEVDTAGLPQNAVVTATLAVGGFARRCSTDVSCSTTIIRGSKPSSAYPTKVSDRHNVRNR
jgi:hypothetical protein